jgi:NTP pyrophosphohydrolases including oxidative damage repair enzymes
MRMEILKKSKVMAQAGPKVKRLLIDQHCFHSNGITHHPTSLFMDIFPLEIRQRIPSPSRKSQISSKRASVLVPLIHITDLSQESSTIPSILFTKRSSHLRDHASQVSFPGGHLEERDEGCPIRAALRETREELTSTSSSLYDSYNFEEGVTMLGRTGDIPSMRNVPVTPVVGMFQEEFTMSQVEQFFPGNQTEVERIFAVPMDELWRVEGKEYLPRLGVNGPVYDTIHGKIWGLTALILHPILHRVLIPAFLDGGVGVNNNRYQED